MRVGSGGGARAGASSSPWPRRLLALSLLLGLLWWRQRALHRQSYLVGRELPVRRGGLAVDWLSECGCTGIEIESVALTASLWHAGLRNLRINRCHQDNPRCPGQPQRYAQALQALESGRDGEGLGMPDVAVVHVAFKGICGVPDEYAGFSRCKSLADPDYQPPSRGAVRGERKGRRAATCQRPFMIARAMGEEDSIGPGAAAQCNSYYDEVWVPSSFHRKAFVASGVEAAKVHVVPEIVDFEMYDPGAVEDNYPFWGADSPVRTTVLSVFKWEERKNWRQLLRAFAYVFVFDPSVGLFIKTSRYMGANPQADAADFLESVLMDIKDLADDFGRSQDGILQYPQEVVMAKLEEAWVTDASDPRCILNRVRTEDSRMASRDMPKLYKAAQAFVLPSHGEGWGLPLMEAMAMELPTIGTKFGGNVDFMDPSCSFLLDVAKMSRSGGGGRWAEPDNGQLMTHMLWAAKNPDAAQALGKRARRHVQEKFSAEAITSIMEARLEDIGRRVITGAVKSE